MTGHVPSQVIDSTTIQCAYQIGIIGGTFPSIWQLNVSTSGPSNFSGGAQTYLPYVLSVTDVVKDDKGFSRASFALRVKQPYRIGFPTATLYDDIYDAMAAYRFHGASALIRIESVDSTGEQHSQLIAGKIVHVTEATPQSVTFHVEQRRELDQTFVPSRVLERTAFDTDQKKNRIPEANAGSALPAPLGRAYTWLPSWYNVDDRNIHLEINAAGIRPKAFSCLEVQRETTDRRLIYAEKTGLPIETDAVDNPHDGFVYHSSAEIYSRLWEGSPNGKDNYGRLGGTWDDKGWAIKLNHAPYLQASVVAVATNEDDSVGLTNGEYAIDQKLETWATLAYNADSKTGGVWDIPTVDKLGRLSQNTNSGNSLQDFEGPGAPAGVAAFVLIAVPPGFVRPLGTVRLGLKFPDSSDWFFNGQSTLSRVFGTLDVIPGGVELLKANQQVADPNGAIGGYDNGWAGTKWEDWEFGAAIAEFGDDQPLWNQNSTAPTNSGEGVRVRVVNNTSNQEDLAIISVGLIVSFREHWKVRGIANFDINALPTRWVNDGSMEYRRDAKGEIISYKGRKFRFRRPKLTVDPSAINNRLFYRNRFTPTAPSYIDNIFISQAAYNDGLAAAYTGTADKVLENPADWAHFRLVEYGEGTALASSGHGRFDEARDSLDSWYQLAGGSGQWSGAIHETNTRVTVGEDLDAIQENLPLTVVKDKDGVWGGHVWIPRTSDWPTESYFRPTSVIDPVSEILVGAEGLAFSATPADTSVLVNELTINYDYDKGRREYMRTAKCDANGSDDGYGGTWANAVGSGAGASAMCSWSQAEFRLTANLDLDLPGVFSPHVAEAIGLHYLWRFYRLPVIVNFSAGLALLELQNYQVFKLGNALQDVFGMKPWFLPGSTWEDIYWRASSVEVQENYDGRGNAVRHLEIAAEIYPTSIGDEI